MTFQEIMEIASESPGWIALIIVVVSGLIEVSPIKINPWGKIAKSVGKAINADVMKELETVKKTQADITQQLDDRVRVEDERNANSQRERILQFNVEVMRNEKHTREDFIEILSVVDLYEKYCKDHPDYPNNRAVHAVANIERVYDERLKKNDFYKAEEGVSE